MRHRDPAQTEELLRLLRRGPAAIAELEQHIGVTRRTLLRWLRERDDVRVAGAASRTRYALQRALRGRLERYPVFRIDSLGQASQAGDLSLVWPEGSLFELAALGWPVDPDSRDGWWQGLPYPFYDMRPQGFLGRGFARQYHALLDVAADPRDWSDDDVVHILSRVGWDSSGDLIVGEAALARWQAAVAAAEPAIAPDSLERAYLEQASQVASLGQGGSSAAGEFPKFTAVRALAGAATEHVIVKFSGAVMPGATQRWSDLLVCESLAAQCAAGLAGIASARTRIVQAAGRTFLESERFDRVGRFGRLPLVSLEAINGHLLGTAAGDWRQPLQRLQDLGLLAAEQGNAALRLWWFGRLIGNTDMHFGNLSFYPEDGRLRLAPVYDMLPMAYAPLPGGELPQVPPLAALPPPAQQPAWEQACTQALAFWALAQSDLRISADFRTLCTQQEQALHQLRRHLRP